MTAALIAAAVVFGLLVSFTICLLVGSAIHRADEAEFGFDPFDELDLTPDRADVPFDWQPSREFVDRTRRLVVDETRRLRSVT